MDVTFYKKNSVHEIDCVIDFIKTQMRGVVKEDYFTITEDVVSGARPYDIMEVFDTIYKEFSEELVNSNISMENFSKLRNIYEKHKRYIEEIKNEL